MISSFHGIGAYRGQKNPLALKRALDTALSGVELCCADRPIGAFGAVFLGDRYKGERDYCESWITPCALRAVWVKDWASEAVKKTAWVIAKNRGVKLIIVKGNTRIWDVLDFYNLPIRMAS